MFSFDLVKSVFVCSWKTCQKYLVDPVILPCGYTVCREHLKPINGDLSKENIQFTCDICNKEHKTSINLIVINHSVSKIIQEDIHLSQQQKVLKASIKQIEALLLQHDNSKLANPEEYIYDHTIVLHRLAI